MPIYDYKCHSCQSRREVWLKLAELDSAVVHCLHCNNAMNRQVSAPHIQPDYPGYTCPITEKWIEGRRAHVENLARHGCRILEPGETEQAARRRQAAEDEFDRKIENTYEELVSKMSTEKRDRLAAEMEAGVSAEVVRTTPTTTS